MSQLPGLTIVFGKDCKPISMRTPDGKDLKAADGPPTEGTITAVETVTIMSVKINPDCYWVYFGGQWHWICT